MEELYVNTKTFGGAFAKAFAAFQAEVQNPKLNKENPHLRNRYADLSEVLNTVRPILAKHGLSFYQDVATMEDKDKVVCVTTVFHESGEYLTSSPLSIPYATGGKLATAQVIGAAASYAKRYQIQAMFGIAAEEDDDGEALVTQPQQNNYNLQTTTGPSKQALAAKYQLGTGSRDGFDEYYDKQIEEGRNHAFIDSALDKAIAKKKKQLQEQKEPQPAN